MIYRASRAKHACESRGITQRLIATRAGVSQPYVQGCLSGRCTASAKVKTAVRDLLAERGLHYRTDTWLWKEDMTADPLNLLNRALADRRAVIARKVPGRSPFDSREAAYREKLDAAEEQCWLLARRAVKNGVLVGLDLDDVITELQGGRPADADERARRQQIALAGLAVLTGSHSVSLPTRSRKPAAERAQAPAPDLDAKLNTLGASRKRTQQLSDLDTKVDNRGKTQRKKPGPKTKARWDADKRRLEQLAAWERAQKTTPVKRAAAPVGRRSRCAGTFTTDAAGTTRCPTCTWTTRAAGAARARAIQSHLGVARRSAENR